MCLVLAVPKGNFKENKGDSRAAQITLGETQCCSWVSVAPLKKIITGLLIYSTKWMEHK